MWGKIESIQEEPKQDISFALDYSTPVDKTTLDNAEKGISNNMKCEDDSSKTIAEFDDHANKEYREEVFSKNGLFSFAGRRNRLPFFLMHLLLYPWIISNSNYAVINVNRQDYLWMVVNVIVVAALGYVYAVNIVKRLHDLNTTGYLALGLIVCQSIPVISIFACIFWLFLIFLKAEPGMNKYGMNPLEMPENKNLKKRFVIAILGLLSFVLCAPVYSSANMLLKQMNL